MPRIESRKLIKRADTINIIPDIKELERYLELAKRLQAEDHFGIFLDVSHMLLAGGKPEQRMEKLKPYIRHFHLNDTNMKSDGHLALGKGMSISLHPRQKSSKTTEGNESTIFDYSIYYSQQEANCINC